MSLRTLRNAGLMLAAVSGIASAQAGLTSTAQAVTINATKVATLTLTINSGATQTLASLTDNATNNFASSVNFTTAWDINPSASSVSVVGYFGSATSALANGTDLMPSSWIKGKMGAAGTFTAFTGGPIGTVGTAGASLTLFTQAITGANKKANRTDDLFLQIDLTGQAATPGTYTGTLNLRAVTQ